MCLRFDDKTKISMAPPGLRLKYDVWSGVPKSPWEKHEELKGTDSFRSILPLIRVANVFGLVPLSATNGSFRFAWLSFRTAYAAVVLLMLASFVVVRILSVFVATERQDDWVRLFTSTAFYSLAALGALLLYNLSRKLPEVCARWSQLESRLAVKGSARVVVVVILAVVLVSATGETVASMFFSLSGNCTGDFWVFLRCYVKSGHEYEIDLLGYSDAMGLVILFINKYATFIWNFIDIFVSCVALILLRHIRLYNARVEDGYLRWTGKDWRNTREDHLNLLRLVNSINEVFGPIILQSYVTNLLFTTVQLYLGIRPRSDKDITTRLYLTWSFLHLLGRLLLVSLSCTAVYEASKKSMICILNVPVDNYNVDVWRLQHQVQEQEIGLTGYGFFLVNKSFILAVSVFRPFSFYSNHEETRSSAVLSRCRGDKGSLSGRVSSWLRLFVPAVGKIRRRGLFVVEVKVVEFPGQPIWRPLMVKPAALWYLPATNSMTISPLSGNGTIPET
ncbi:gustatory receptor for sugar taste 64e-like [Macrobrachium rosenbergii]|uniref:gustatory receptor for sugar taste 64e-like n=1 Tax=Macrobrachium rosenbergii TaxID=79674 RepID=UPI0034D52783